MVMSKYPLEHLLGSQPVEGVKRDEGERGRYSIHSSPLYAAF